MAITLRTIVSMTTRAPSFRCAPLVTSGYRSAWPAEQWGERKAPRDHRSVRWRTPGRLLCANVRTHRGAGARLAPVTPSGHSNKGRSCHEQHRLYRRRNRHHRRHPVVFRVALEPRSFVGGSGFGGLLTTCPPAASFQPCAGGPLIGYLSKQELHLKQRDNRSGAAGRVDTTGDFADRWRPRPSRPSSQ